MAMEKKNNKNELFKKVSYNKNDLLKKKSHAKIAKHYDL